MKTRLNLNISRCLALLPLVIAIGLDAAREPIKPRWKWESGESRRYRLELEREQTVEGEQEYETKLRFDAVILLQPVMREDGATVIDLEFESLDITRHAGDLHYRFNSDRRPRRADESSVWKLAGEALMDNSLRLRQEPTGELNVLEGFDKPLATVLEGKKFSKRREIFQILSLFGDKGVSRILNRCLDVCPPSTTEDQGKWTKVEDVDLQMDIDVRRRLEYLLKDHRAPSNIVIGMEGNMELVDGERETVQLPGGTASVEIMENSLTGETVFSLEEGGILTQTHKGLIEIETVITEDGDDVEPRKIRSFLEQTSKLELISPGEKD